MCIQTYPTQKHLKYIFKIKVIILAPESYTIHTVAPIQKFDANGKTGKLLYVLTQLNVMTSKEEVK